MATPHPPPLRLDLLQATLACHAAIATYARNVNWPHGAEQLRLARRDIKRVLRATPALAHLTTDQLGALAQQIVTAVIAQHSR